MKARTRRWASHKAVAKAAEQKLHTLEDRQFKDLSAMGAVRLP